MNSNHSLPPGWFDGLVSPKTCHRLHLKGDTLLESTRKEKFEVSDNIAQLLIPEFRDEVLEEELKAMDALPVFGVAYFQQDFLESLARKIFGFLQSLKNSSPAIVEIGGGEGHFSRNFLKCGASRVFVSDLCEKALKLVPSQLRKVRCDARYPFCDKESVDINVFWVSLHHFPLKDSLTALSLAVESLKPNGLLVLFEPNTYFFPRRILLKSPLRKDVYFDDAEKPLDYLAVEKIVEPLGLQRIETRFIQPPYNLEFLKRLRNWPFYYIVVNILYWFDRWIGKPLSHLLFGRNPERHIAIRKYLASYFLSVYRKPPS